MSERKDNPLLSNEERIRSLSNRDVYNAPTIWRALDSDIDDQQLQDCSMSEKYEDNLCYNERLQARGPVGRRQL